MNKRSTFAFLLPIIISLALVSGMYIGKNLASYPEHQIIYSTGSKPLKADKLQRILKVIESDYVDTVDMQRITEKTINMLLSELDPHSYYSPPAEKENFDQEIAGAFEGIGIEFNVVSDTIVVISAISGGPSEKLGIRAGDRIVKIEEDIVAGVNIRRDEVVKQLRGKKGTTVNVSIRRKGVNEDLPFSIIRDKIPLYTVDASYMIAPGTGYIKLNRFGEQSAREVLQGIEKLKKQGMERLIFDLRGNPGGMLSAAIEITDYFLEAGQVITYTQGRSRRKRIYRSSRENALEKEPIVILIDEGSASASEIIAGAIQDHDRGLIIGRRSFGKGLVQEIIDLRDGSAMNLSVARYYTPSGRCIQKPYDKGNENYYEQVYLEILGEAGTDTSSGKDTTSYRTRNGRIVFGGGGIQPDIVTNPDTAGYTPMLGRLINRGTLYDFAFEWSDKNRQRLLATYTNALNFSKDPQVSKLLLNAFRTFASKENIALPEKEWRISQESVSRRLRAMIARNVWGNEAFFQVINYEDPTVREALKALEQPQTSLLYP
jgi:carboxyl-terminal processing protease